MTFQNKKRFFNQKQRGLWLKFHGNKLTSIFVVDIVAQKIFKKFIANITIGEKQGIVYFRKRK